MTLDPIGYALDSGRAVFIAEVPRIEDLPTLISLPCSRFVLLLAYSNKDIPAPLVDALGHLLDVGCVYLCAWGPGCEQVHDTMDDVVLERELNGGAEMTIMTTWHDQQPLADAVDFALRWGVPDAALADGCEAIVLAAVGNSEWTQALKTLSAQYLRPGL